MEKYVKVFIKSESDLPKEGKFHFHILGDSSLRFKDVEGASFRQLKRKVDYYLKPISDTELIVLSEEQIEKKLLDLFGFIEDGIDAENQLKIFSFMDWIKTQPKNDPLQGKEKNEVQEFMDDVHKWADSTFGTERTALAPLYHLREEVDEVISEMKKGFPGLTMKEMADCFIFILNATSKYGYTFAQLLEIAKEKMIVNKTRNWGKPDANGVCKHIVEQPKEVEGLKNAEEICKSFLIDGKDLMKARDIERIKFISYGKVLDLLKEYASQFPAIDLRGALENFANSFNEGEVKDIVINEIDFYLKTHPDIKK